MENRDARILLNIVLFPGDKDQTYVIAVSGHHNRMVIHLPCLYIYIYIYIYNNINVTDVVIYIII